MTVCMNCGNKNDDHFHKKTMQNGRAVEICECCSLGQITIGESEDNLN